MISVRTVELLEELRTCSHWFNHIGTPPGLGTVEQVHELPVAVEMYHSLDWENTCLAASNGLTMRLDRDFLTRFNNWNKHIKAIDQVLIPIVDPIAIRFIEEHPEVEALRETFKFIRRSQGKPKPHECLKFRQTLLSTLRMACMEAEYSDIIPLAFFSEMSAWYLAGHLPCGLTEEYPNGKLIVI